jgi:sulfite exporter TauE/SafE
MFLLSALLVGFLGSFHCAGMCGPIAMALPVRNNSTTSFIAGRLLYNTGRIFTYIWLGFSIGLIGHSIALAGFQKTLSIVSGILLLAFAILSLFFRRINSPDLILIKYTNKIKQLFKSLFGKKSMLTLFLIGTVNGLLPCGFVYLALIAAAATGSFFNSMFYMFLFGLGTLPMMLSISFAGNLLNFKFQKYIRRGTPYIAAAVAVLLIIRGVNMHTCCQR